MSWRDREYGGDTPDRFGRPGGDWQGIRPTFDNPMSWSLPLLTALDIRVRVHVIFLIFIVIRLARSLTSSADSMMYAALHVACLFLVVLLHEFGHCLACRRVKGEANEILMWPLGGLAFCRPPTVWRAHLVTAIGGPMVNVVIFIVLAPLLVLVTGRFWGIAVPHPLVLLPEGLLINGREHMWLNAIYFLHSTSFLLLLFNLLPIYPLDGGRIIQASLWPKYGYERSTRFAVYSGYIGAIGLGIVGAVMQQWLLVGIAFFGGITCWLTLKQLQWTSDLMGLEDDAYAASLWQTDEPEEPQSDRRAERRAAAREEEEREIDRILAKIGKSGVESLSSRERRLLKQATARRQKEKTDPDA